MNYTIEMHDRPKWFQIRRRIAACLVAAARKVYPESPEAKAFLMQQVADQMLYGQAIAKIDPAKFYETKARS